MERVLPSRDDPFVAALSESVGGPAGSRTAPHPWWSPERGVLALTTLGCAVGVAVTYVLGSPVGLATAAGTTVLALLTTWLLARVEPGRPWDAAGFAAAPLLVFLLPWAWGVVGVGLLAVPLLAAAAWAWARGRRVPAGVLLAVALGVVLRTVLAHHASGDGPDGSWWLVAQQARGEWFPTDGVRVGAGVVAVVWCALVALVAVRAPVRPRAVQIAFLVAAGLVLALPVNPPTYALWLLPLAVLARPRWRDLVVWQAFELVHAVLHVWFLEGLLHPVGEGSAVLYWAAVLGRIVGLLWLVGAVVRDVLRPLPGQSTTIRSNVVAV